MKTIGCLLLFAIETTLIAQGRSKADPADAVLDRLERRLLEQEAKTLRLQAPPVSDSKSIKVDVPASSANSISAPLPLQVDFAAIDQGLLTMDQEIDDLAGQVEKLKADFQTHAGKASFIEIVVELEAPQETSLRNLAFFINDHKIYTRNSGGSWNPGAQILLYSGPLEAGTHKIRLEARTVRRYGEGLPLDENTYQQYQDAYELTVPAGPFKKGFRLKLSKPETQNIHAKAVFENYEIK